MTKIFEREEVKITYHLTDSCADCGYFDDEHTACKHYQSQMKTGHPANIPDDVLIPTWCPLPEEQKYPTIPTKELKSKHENH